MSNIVNLKNDLDVSRKNMPQIAAKDIPEFLRFLTDKGVSYKQTREKVSNLKPTQKHLNIDKVKGMVNNFDVDKVYQYFIVSKGNRILDGHHRWAAIKVKDKDADINIIRVNLPISKLIELGHDFDLSFAKGVTEVIKLKPLISEDDIHGFSNYHRHKNESIDPVTGEDEEYTKHMYKPGEVWLAVTGRKWGAKNLEGKVEYFPRTDRGHMDAGQYAKSHGQSGKDIAKTTKAFIKWHKNRY